MKIAVACDHGGLNLKRAMIAYVEKLGHEVVDFGTNTFDSCDYPDFALPADTIIKASPFVFKEGVQHRQMQEDRLHLFRLMLLLDSKPYYIEQENNIYKVEK